MPDEQQSIRIITFSSQPRRRLRPRIGRWGLAGSDSGLFGAPTADLTA
jgi:hypothetical protein